MVMTADDPVSRPDPFTGQLLPIQSANYYGQLPFNQANSTATPMFSPVIPAPGDVQLTPGYSVGAPANPPAAGDFPPNYFYVIANPPVASTENSPPTATATLTSAYDPLLSPSPTTSPAALANVVPPGYCPNLASVAVAPATSQAVTTKSNTMPPNVPQIAAKQMMYYWICLRRPANPFAPPQPDPTVVDASGHSTYNPMIVVDALRFPYIEAGGTAGPPATLGTNMLFSSQRCQPFRGGHAVRLPSDTSNAAAPLYTPYGYSEQMAQPTLQSANYGYSGGATGNQVTQKIYHTIGQINDQPEPWDYFPFNDRDFTSVAELMLVPGCPPGLFTKQFVELAPMPPSTTTYADFATNDIPRAHHHPDQPKRPDRIPAGPLHRHTASGAQCRGCVPRGHGGRRPPARSLSRTPTRTSWISSSTAATAERP